MVETYSTYRLKLEKVSESAGQFTGQGLKVRTVHDLSDLIRTDLSSLDREHFIRYDLDCKCMIIGKEIVAIGALDYCHVHPREVFKGAILNNAHSIIIAHNHPSGSTTPSTEDIHLMNVIRDGGNLLGIKLLDAITYADGSILSYIDMEVKAK